MQSFFLFFFFFLEQNLNSQTDDVYNIICFVLFQRYSLAKIGARALQRTHNTSYLIGSVPDLLALASGKRKLNKTTNKKTKHARPGVLN